ncbi:TraX family protein [Enterococcus malodoratus]|uniref:TraX family protein n=1 Tax=Enterococcus malodoratus TaxID=71451 RepID=UPI0039AEC6FB
MNKSIDGFKLKVIAIIAMLLNHIGSGFDIYEQSHAFYFFTEFIGKLTFPIMAYLLVEGFHYTRNRRKYAERMAIFWLVSIYPFHMLFGGNHSFSPIELVNNIFFTLLMGLLLLMAYEQVKSPFLQNLLVIFFSIMTMASDWSLIGVLLIFGFYKWKNESRGIWLPVVYTAAFLVLILGMMNLSDPQRFPLYEVFTGLGTLMVIPLLHAYNGERGYSPQWVKWGFYGFYPIHLTILALIRMVIH